MSGGVDSSVAAALLQEQGFEVIGVTLRLWDGPGSCCSTQDAEDARRVAERLGIPFHTLEYAQAFQAAVVDDFLDAHLAGQTPNPCARCNERIKFDRLLAQARELGADYLATGHYARIEADADGARLRTGLDGDKDQSYFLATTPADELDAIRFPLGGLTKDRVREMAEGYGLITAGKAESQDICFVPRGAVGDFLAAYRSHPALEPGPIVDREGQQLGRHRGAAYYTVGQRRGLGLALGYPVYVAEVDTASNRVVVAPEADLYSDAMRVAEVNWLGPAIPAAGVTAEVKIRYGGPVVPARVTPEGDGLHVAFSEPQRAVAPGQLAAFYDGDTVLGGAWIREAA
jgi:tRNA-specific 2-thiouridylase